MHPSYCFKQWFGELARLTKPRLTALGITVLTVLSAHADIQNPTYTERIERTPCLGHPLVWIGDAPPSEQESLALWESTGEGKMKAPQELARGVEGYVNSYPDSPWRAAIENRLGMYCRNSGYFSPALKHWERGWNLAKGATDPKAMREADTGLIQWLDLLASLGRTDKMKELFDETAGRPIAGILHNTYQSLKLAYTHMLTVPGDSYRCGTFALNAVSKALTGNDHFTEIVQLKSPASGFSMAKLLEIADSNRLNLVAAERSSGEDLVVPCVVHWKQNHYAAIVERRGDGYEVVDPTFKMKRWLTGEAINAEASGAFLIPADRKPSNWRNLTIAEAENIFGKGYPGGDFDLPPGPPCPSSCGCATGGEGGGVGVGDAPVGPASPGGNPQAGPCGSCTGGMPRWLVTESDEMLWLMDEPLSYQTATGGRMSFKVYRHDWATTDIGDGYEETSEYPWGYSFGEECWRASWVSYLTYDNNTSVTVYPPGGGMRTYTNWNGTALEFYTNTRLIGITNGGVLKGFSVLFPDGSMDTYTNANDLVYSGFLLSQQMDPHGRSTTYVYEPSGLALVDYVVDCDGRTNTFFYGMNPVTGVNSLLTKMTDPYGRSVTFTYYPTGEGNSISNITDPQGITTTFTYLDPYDEVLTNMTTPYGTTRFAFGHTGSFTNVDTQYLYWHVTEPDGGQQLYLFIEGGGFTLFPEVYTNTANVPTNRPVDTVLGGVPTNTVENPDWGSPGANDVMNIGNCFYWNRAQYENLSGTFLNSPATNYGVWNFDDLTASDFANGRLRHWTQSDSGGQGRCLAMEQLPSPASGAPGKMTWWDYPNKPNFYQEGSSAFPSLVIRVQPDGSTWYEMYQFDQWGNRTNVIDTYSSNGVVMLRTNTYVYSANTVDLLQVIRPDGVTDASYVYNANHQVLFWSNAVGYVTSYTYNTNQQLTSVTEPTGLVTTNIYDANNRLSTSYSYSGTVYFGTNTYTYTNDLVYMHADPRGLTTTSSWDNLERLTNIAYPGGTSMTYVYSNLDIVQIIDRLGHSSYFTYDAIRRMTSSKDVNGNTTGYGYCNCGGLDYITNALLQVTQYDYDNQGNMTEGLYPDGYDVYNTFNSIRQLVVRSDSANVSVSNWFNNQGGLIAVSNSAGQVLSRVYDIDDRLVQATDQNGVATSMTYDNLGRTLSRSYPDGGVEHFGYSSFGLMAYTNQLTNRTYYGYDAERWKTAETNALGNTNQYGYSPAGDLTTLTDQKGNTTQWGYDQYGRVTNKVDATGASILQYEYDADSRLTNRWSLARGNTGYGYDAVGNLTSVKYAVSHSLSFSYNAVNWMTSMADGTGTTTFTYTQVGQLASETGPWASDAVSYSYVDRLRSSLSLQQPYASAWVQSYGYDGANRMNSIASPVGTFTYSYNPGLAGTTSSSSLVGNIALPNGAWITNTFDNNGRMLGTWLYKSGGSALDSSVYTYNVGNQRTSVTRTGENTASYLYDQIGQVLADQATEVSGGATRLNEQLHYAFDAAGNLAYRTNNAMIENFRVNSVNELTTNTNGGTLTVVGTTTSPATSVSVNGNAATIYSDETFAVAGLPLTTTYTATAADSYGRHSTNTVTVSLSTNVIFQYDGNGNLTNDGLRNFVYDDENELIQVSVSNAWMSQFAYDGKMRRRVRTEYTWQGTTWVQTNQVYYVYDGNMVIQERNANNLPMVTYTRGKDLSGSLEGAGGIGGLLARTDQANATAAYAESFYHCDGNGNVTMLVDSYQGIAAKYLYDAFGNTISKSGMLADGNLYRFSSKEWHQNSGLAYYLYRYYDPNLQRWPNRDPFADLGFEVVQSPLPIEVLNSQRWAERIEGPNLYEYVRNAPTGSVDTDGMGTFGDVASGMMNGLKNNWGKLSAGVGGTMCVIAGDKCYQAIKAAADAAAKYQNTANTLNQKYGDSSDWPSGVQQLMAQWQQDNIKLAGDAAKACLKGVPGTSGSGPVNNPTR
jgi:RHS repeat-associated protein